MVKAGERFLSLIYLINLGAWIISYLLLKFEYKRRLSEAYYAHYAFWILNFLLILVTVIVNYRDYVKLSFNQIGSDNEDSQYP